MRVQQRRANGQGGAVSCVHSCAPFCCKRQSTVCRPGGSKAGVAPTSCTRFAWQLQGCSLASRSCVSDVCGWQCVAKGCSRVCVCVCVRVCVCVCAYFKGGGRCTMLAMLIRMSSALSLTGQ